jgi:hypothetical protein
VVEPIDVAEAGPSIAAERAKHLTKGKGKAAEEESVHNGVGESEAIGLSEEQWTTRQCFLADRVLQKCLEIEALFREVATLEGMMGEM